MNSYSKYLKRPNAKMPKVHLDILDKGEAVASTSVLERAAVNRLFDKGYLEAENGFHRAEDGSTYVACLTKMPNVTLEMLNWWFWWHAAEGMRYQIWYPEMHYDISADFQGYYNDESKSYSERLHLSTHLVTEDVGMGKDKILIDFMHPNAFGCDKNKNKLKPDEVTIICARVGSPDKGVWGTEMCHFVRKVEQGVEMRSRFWLGHKVERMGGLAQGLLNSILNQGFVKRQLLPKNLGSSMFHHCSQEYHNLASFLPALYQEESMS